MPAADELAARLDDAAACVLEEPARSAAIAVEVLAAAADAGLDGIRVRALAAVGTAALERADLEEAGRCATAADADPASAADPAAGVEVAALRGQLAFFTGAYPEALEAVGTAIALADAAGDERLRLRARRRACVVLGNLDDPGWPEHLQEVLALCESAGSPWELAAAHNDLATHKLVQGDVEGALAGLETARGHAARVAGESGFLHALLGATATEVLSAAGRPLEAVREAAGAVRLLLAREEPHPYLLGMAVLVQVRALIAAGRPDDAAEAADTGRARLGETAPHARAQLQREAAVALKAAGHADRAFEALMEAADLERVAFRQFTELQLAWARATAAGAAAVEEAERLRVEAERDPLTGLSNRRHLLRAAAALPPGAPLGVAAVDLDHFKAVNDRFGHDAGDRVLVRVARLLRRLARGSDVVARTGGEEFVVLMPGAGLTAVHAFGERVRSAVATEDWSAVAPGLRVTTSVGAAAGETGHAALLGVADRRLYAAKRAGRDRVVAS